ncbi:hypothetical protein Tgr7_0422 [Thioalkalivibrio sulfidiphilus HL-EbGr7]|uniref:Uncharacterized protein n=1 Tax=Thioalkalivibrio sulfidiphilus (strain HL-EbGR7) TaxID=396588 RepID=B8GL02_THISH|nr:hypothetical protein [Thioalkalivibrio sulfidiphilus]ACL71520.1 hypothetical protein Tgr7_0422 [Thioalkalivibrio sulfidiphilus HL-EbGr7]
MNAVELARVAGKAAFAEDPERPMEQALAQASRGDPGDALLAQAFRDGWDAAQDEYLAGLTPRGRTLYRFRLRDRLDSWRRQGALT